MIAATELASDMGSGPEFLCLVAIAFLAAGYVLIKASNIVGRGLIRKQLLARTLRLNHRADGADYIEELRQLILRQSDLVLFCGAGMSATAGFPEWTQLLRVWGTEVGCLEDINNKIDEGDYEGAAQLIEEKRSPLWLRTKIKGAFGRDLTDQRILGSVAYLPAIAQGPVVTTNFDRVLEVVFQRAGKPFKVIGYPDELGPVQEALDEPSRRPFLLKIHGDAAAPNWWVLTRVQYARHYGAEKGFDPSAALPSVLTHIVRARRVIFVGCSLNKDRFLEVIQSQARESTLWARHFAFLSLPDEQKRFEREAQLIDHGIKPIWYPIHKGRHTALEALLASFVQFGSCTKENEIAYSAAGATCFILAASTLVANRVLELQLYWVVILGIPLLSLMLGIFLLPLALRHALRTPSRSFLDRLPPAFGLGRGVRRLFLYVAFIFIPCWTLGHFQLRVEESKIGGIYIYGDALKFEGQQMFALDAWDSEALKGVRYRWNNPNGFTAYPFIQPWSYRIATLATLLIASAHVTIAVTGWGCNVRHE
jgi:hypothetical protein